MEGLLTLQKCTAEAHLDMVRLSFADRVVQVPYQTLFQILAGVRMAAKMAMREEGNKVGLWNDLAAIAREGYDARPARHFRRSILQSNIGDYKVKYVPGSPLVNMIFTPHPTGHPLLVKIHYSDALQFYSLARVQARAAKAWAGDSSRTWQPAAHLSDGEDDYKRGFN